MNGHLGLPFFSHYRKLSNTHSIFNSWFWSGDRVQAEVLKNEARWCLNQNELYTRNVFILWTFERRTQRGIPVCSELTWSLHSDFRKIECKPSQSKSGSVSIHISKSATMRTYSSHYQQHSLTSSHTKSYKITWGGNSRVVVSKTEQTKPLKH